MANAGPRCTQSPSSPQSLKQFWGKAVGFHTRWWAAESTDLWWLPHYGEFLHVVPFLLDGMRQTRKCVSQGPTPFLRHWIVQVWSCKLTARGLDSGDSLIQCGWHGVMKISEFECLFVGPPLSKSPCPHHSLLPPARSLFIWAAWFLKSSEFVIKWRRERMANCCLIFKMHPPPWSL